MTTQNKKVTDIETSKKLAEVMKGVETACIWAWHDNDGVYVVEYKDVSGWAGAKHEESCFSWYPAYDLQDILDRLPSAIKYKGSRYRLTTMKFNDNLYDITYHNYGAVEDTESSRDLMEQEGINHKGFKSRTLLHAAASLLIWCADNGHMEVVG